MSNDSMEGRVVSKIIHQFVKEDSLDLWDSQKFDQAMDFSKMLLDGLGFCLSEEGDLLSQWRGYANDASGVSIGFSKQYLEELVGSTKDDKAQIATILHQVTYNKSKQLDLIRPFYQKLKDEIAKGAFRPIGNGSFLDLIDDREIKKDNEETKNTNLRVLVELLRLFPQIFTLKPVGFKEEKEWRLVSRFLKNSEDTSSFRASKSRLIPYRELKLGNLNAFPIAEVILAPKNLTPRYVIETFLRLQGFTDVQVSYSESSYQ